MPVKRRTKEFSRYSNSARLSDDWKNVVQVKSKLKNARSDYYFLLFFEYVNCERKEPYTHMPHRLYAELLITFDYWRCITIKLSICLWKRHFLFLRIHPSHVALFIIFYLWLAYSMIGIINSAMKSRSSYSVFGRASSTLGCMLKTFFPLLIKTWRVKLILIDYKICVLFFSRTSCSYINPAKRDKKFAPSSSWFLLCEWNCVHNIPMFHYWTYITRTTHLFAPSYFHFPCFFAARCKFSYAAMLYWQLRCASTHCSIGSLHRKFSGHYRSHYSRPLV